jgi:dTDP-4-amino-4,6-dideoxygalactose transaminase
MTENTGRSIGSSKRIYLSPPDVGALERQLLVEAFDSNWIAPLGPHVDEFEREMAAYLGVQSTAALSSGTAALHLGLTLLGVGVGDLVFCSTFTFAATANAIRYCNAEPVFIDSDEDSWNMDPNLLQEELERAASRGKLPKAAVVVDLYGQPADYERIEAVCARFEVPLIEDAAEALGASHRGKRAGGFGVFAILSFNGNKIITTSGGGMLVSNSDSLTERARFLASQARDPAPHYQHSEIGYNYRMSNLLAAVGRGQLRGLDEKVARRRENFCRYRDALGDLPGFTFMPEPDWSHSTRWLTCITIEPQESNATREDLRLALEKENIESRPLWKPMHLQPVFRDARVVGGAVSQRLFEKGLCLPSGSSLKSEELERVVNVIRSECSVEQA